MQQTASKNLIGRNANKMEPVEFYINAKILYVIFMKLDGHKKPEGQHSKCQKIDKYLPNGFGPIFYLFAFFAQILLLTFIYMFISAPFFFCMIAFFVFGHNK